MCPTTTSDTDLEHWRTVAQDRAAWKSAMPLGCKADQCPDHTHNYSR